MNRWQLTKHGGILSSHVLCRPKGNHVGTDYCEIIKPNLEEYNQCLN